MKTYNVSVVVEQDDDGYVAFCPDLQGCYAQGDSYEEVMAQIQDAVKLHLEDRIEDHEDVDSSKRVSLTTLQIAI